MPRTKNWDEFEKVQRSGGTAMDKLDQILDTVTELALKEDSKPEAQPMPGPEAAGEAPEAAPEIPAGAPATGMQPEGGEPPMDAGATGGEPAMDAPPAGMPPADGAPMDAGAMPPEAAGGMPEEMPPVPMDAGNFMGSGDIDFDDYEEDSDVDKLLDAAKDVKDPVMKQKLLAIAYEALDQEQAMMPQGMPPEAAMMGAGPEAPMGDVPPELAALGADGAEGAPMGDMPPEAALGGGEGEIAPEVAQLAEQLLSGGAPGENPDDLISRSKEGFAPMGDTDKGLQGNASSIKASDDKEDEKKVDEPGVSDAPEGEESDDEGDGAIAVVEADITPVNGGESDENSEKKEAIMSILKSQMNSMIEKAAEQVVEAVEGISESGDESIEDMINKKFSGDTVKACDTVKECDGAEVKRAEPLAKPDNYDSMDDADLLTFIGQNFDRFEDGDVDELVSILDELYGSEKVNEIFQALGIDLNDIYESGESEEEPDGDEDGGEAEGDHEEPDGDEPEGKEEESEEKEEKSEEKEEKKEEKEDDEKVERNGKHIPGIVELMADAVARSKGTLYTPAPAMASSGQTVVLPGDDKYNNVSIKDMVSDRMKR